jgi:SAM-dependent methyltransferase
VSEKLRGVDLSKGLEKEIESSPYMSAYYRGIPMDVQLKYVRDTIDFVKPQGRMLSVGCGFGVIEILMKDMRNGIDEVVGIDIVLKKVQHMRGLAKNLGIDRFESTLGDGVRLPFPEESFDCVLQIESLSHVGNARRALSEATRVLRKGGTLLVQDFNNGMNPRCIYRSWKLKRFRNITENVMNPYFVGAELRSLDVGSIEIKPYNFPAKMRGFRRDFWGIMGQYEKLAIFFSAGFMLRGKKNS